MKSQKEIFLEWLEIEKEKGLTGMYVSGISESYNTEDLYDLTEEIYAELNSMNIAKQDGKYERITQL